LLPVLLLLAVAIVYRPAWGGDLLWDDDAHITRPALRSAHGLWRIWTDLGATQQYYPLLHSAFWFQHRLWGDAVQGYHLVSLALHAISAWLIALILRRLAVPGAVLAAVVFAVHPVHVESVAWISELKNTLSGTFYLAAALAYLRFDDLRKGRLYALALGCFVLGLFTKTVTAVLPAALLVVFWWRRGKVSGRRDVLPLLPFFVAGACAGILTAWVERTFIGAEGAEFRFTVIERVLIAGRAIWFYLGKLFWPVNLAFIYPRWEVSAHAWWQYLYPLGVVVLLAVLWRLHGRSRAPLAAFLLFCGTLFPGLGFLNVFPFRYAFVADHFQYLASIPVMAFASACLTHALRRWTTRPAAATALVLVLVAAPLGALTWRQSHDYADAERLYRATIARSPTSWLAHNNLALILLDDGRLEEARAHILEALRLSPGIAEHQLNMGRLLLGEGAPAQSVPYLQEAVRLNPLLVSAHNNLGVALMRLGRPGEAVAPLAEAVRLQPDHADAHANLASALHRLGRADEAATQVATALALNPDSAAAHNESGLLAMDRRAYDEARKAFARALQIDPGMADAQVNLGVALLYLGRTGEAVLPFEQALRLRPDHAPTRYFLGVAMFRLGRAERAVSRFNEALRLDPVLPNAHNDLGVALRTLGRMDEALHHFREAVRQQPDHGDAQFNLASALHATGRLAEAVDHYRQAIEHSPTDAALHNDYGLALLTLGRRGAAAAEFREALRIEPGLAAAQANLARANRR
jgi:tetratricopeptide (TPR) repeat protein